MKPVWQTWKGYLSGGVSLYEGYILGPRYAGRRRFTRAHRIIAECAAQEEEPHIQIEAHFRLAQRACCLQKTQDAKDWITLGRDRLEFFEKTLPTEKQAQCLVLEGIVLFGMERYQEALAATRRAYYLTPRGTRLSGDIANRLGRLLAEHGTLLGMSRETALDEACRWFFTACTDFRLLQHPDAGDLQALAAANGRAGVAVQRRFGYRDPSAFLPLREAERLFAREVREPCSRATFWRSRARVALSSGYPLEAAWFFLKALLPGCACFLQDKRTE